MPPHPFPAPASRAFISQRLRLHYLDWGNPEARDLLLLHGGQDHAHNWDWMHHDKTGVVLGAIRDFISG